MRVQSNHGTVKSQAVQSKGTSKGGWGPMGHISQTAPRGRDASYVNAPYNCAGSVVAMLARGHGNHSKLTDAQLINRLGRGLVTREGTTPQGVAQMLQRAGVPFDNNALGGSFSTQRVKEQLAKGRMLIAQVRVTDPQTKQASSHYVLVRKMTAKGDFVISDPLKKGTTVVSRQQLAKAVNGAPPDGGLLIPVKRPGGDLPLKAPPPPPAPQMAFDPYAFQYPPGWQDYVARNPFDSHSPPEGYYVAEGNGQRTFIQTSDSSAFDRSGSPRAQQPFQAYRGQQRYGMPQPYGYSRRGYAIQDQFVGAPARPPKPAASSGSKPKPTPAPDKTAFTATDSVYAGVSTAFVDQPASKPSGKKDKPIRLRINYDNGASEGGKPKRPVLKPFRDLEATAKKLLKYKSEVRKGIDELLTRLQNSPFERDRKVLARMAAIELAQGGIGKKIMTESSTG